MTHQEEAYLLQEVNKFSLNSAPPKIKRFYRKLAVRKLKREYGLPLLDIDNFGFKTEIPDKPLKDSNRVLDRSIFWRRLRIIRATTTRIQ